MDRSSTRFPAPSRPPFGPGSKPSPINPSSRERGITMRLLSCGLLVIVVLAGGAVPAPVPAPGEGVIDPVVLPAGVADPAGKVGYLAGAKGLVEAVDLEKGELLWQSKEPARPLVAFDKLLVAQARVADRANRVRVVLFDVKDKGKKVLESEPIVFPEWVSISTAYGKSFSSRATIHKG